MIEDERTRKIRLIHFQNRTTIQTVNGLIGLDYWSEIKEEFKTNQDFLNNYQTKLTSYNKNEMEYVDLIDTPGLCDDREYINNYDEILERICNYVDLILIFIDKDTLLSNNKTKDIIRRIRDKNSDKMKFCLTKIDLIDKYEELSEKLVYLTSSLKDIGVNMDRIYLLPIPEIDDNNQIEKLPDLKKIIEMIKELVNNKKMEFVNEIENDINKLKKETDTKIKHVMTIKDLKFKELVLFVFNMIFVEIMYNI